MKKMTNKKALVWVLTDNRAGNSKQALALAEILGLPYKVKKLKYNILAKLPNFLKFGFMGISSDSKSKLNGKPDVIISAGRRTAHVALALKKKTGAKIVQIMNPGFSYKDIDVVVLPHHDKKPKQKYLKKTVFIHGALTHNDSEVISKESQKWFEHFQNYSEPYIGVLVGGKSKKTNFTKFNAKTLAKMLIGMVDKLGGTLLITTSRRTPKNSIEALENQLESRPDINYYIYDYHNDKGSNPYLALLDLSEKLVVTGDSVSMCSEAVHTGKPVYIFYEENMISSKHRKYLDHLFDKGLASPLYENHKQFKPKKNLGNSVLKQQVIDFLFD